MMNKKLWTIPAAMLLSSALCQAVAVAEEIQADKELGIGDKAPAEAAQPAADTVEIVTFEALDADANGAISPEEAQGNAALTAVWESVDTNQDGQIDEAEFSAVEITSGN